MTSQSAASKLINSQGQPLYGVFAKPVAEVNYQNFDLRSAMDKPLGRLAKHFKFNQFQFIGFTSSKWLIGIAIVDLKWVSHAFVYCYDIQSAAFEEYSFKQPLSFRTRFDNQPNTGLCCFQSGSNSIQIQATVVPGQREVRLQLPHITLAAIIDEAAAYNPLAVCTRAGYQGWSYTQKVAARPCYGSLNWRQKQYDLAALNTLACVDWTAGYMRRETSWNWASFSGRLADGRRCGLNLSAGVNETGFSENALWLDDDLITLPQVHFAFERMQTNGPWQVVSACQRIQLQFEPAGYRGEKINLGLLASNFKQYFGQFSGAIQLPTEQVKLNGLWGLVEDHYAKW